MASKNEQERRETLADIVAQMRGRGEDGRMDRHLWNEYADRIEAAAKRVVVSKTETTTVGNAAAMRDALVRCDAIAQLPEVRNEQSIKDMRNIIKHALSAPARNCDVGTEQEQQDRFREFCRHYESEGECGIGRYEAACPAFQGGRNPDCSLWWAQMPYAAEEGGAAC